jgi:hypothetical protein
MNKNNKACKFNLGLEMEASGSKTSKKYNLHFYILKMCYSLSPTNIYVPLRFSFGLRNADTNFYINFGIFDYNFLFEYRSKKLIEELSYLIENLNKNKITFSISNINKIGHKEYLFGLF